MRTGLFTIILLSYYSGSRIISVYEKLSACFAKEGIDLEFIVMDDGSRDDSYAIAKQLEKQQPNVFAYQLSRNYTSHCAIFAGFTVATGQLVAAMPDDWQTPLESYVKMYREWQNGAQIIIPCRNKRNDGFVNEFFARSYYFMMNRLSDVNFPPLGADIFGIDRELVEIINEHIHPINTSAIIEVLRLGFEPVYIPYERPPSTGNKSRWTFKKKVRLFKDTFYASSAFPIKLITWMGAGSFIMSIIVIIISIILKLMGEENLGGFRVPGWTTTLIIMSFFCGLILLSISVLAEYLLRVFDEVKNRPGFIIRKDK
ncbi:MAG: glycosyltransferase [Candidatus Cloacimonetes bacterium]|nr:glycosyltransferase [Candidatus Cloacimonadota bacterium]